MSHHYEKVREQVAHLAAEYFSRESNGQSLVTVTRCELSSDGARATIYLTVLPEQYEAEVLAFARRKRADLRDYMKAHSRINNLPFLETEIDFEEKLRQQRDHNTPA